MPKLSLQAEEELKAAWSRQLREMERRERLLQSDMQRAGEQVGMAGVGTSPLGWGQYRDAASHGEDVLGKQKPRVLSTKP